MERKLSQTKIESFSGDVLPLILIGEKKFSTEDIRWSCEGDCLQIVSFENAPTDPFTNGVLLTLLSPGEATVKATFENRDYLCRVIVRERVHTPSGRMNYYIGDFHDHTHKSHKKEIVTARDTMLPGDYIRYVKEEGKMDSGVISDHGSVLNYREFFRGFWDALEEEDPNLLIFPGCESEITAVEYDRYEMPHKNSGEIVTLMASAYASVRSWNDFLKNFENSPFAVAILAHPQISGFSVPGIWNFSLHKNNSPRFRQMLKMVEMGDGSDRQSNLINEYIYSVALDQGFRVSTTCSSDSHGPRWGFHRFPGKSVIMATEKTKEAFVDAIMNQRVYGSESGNVKLYYEVNGCPAPADLPLAEDYRFHLELDYFAPDASTHPVKCQVVSDGGKVLATLENFSEKGLDFTISSSTASYFFLRLTDSNGRKTWSPPVFTGRSYNRLPDEALPEEGWKPIDKKGFTAVDLDTGKEAPEILDDNPISTWFSEKSTCRILIDMQEEKTISAVGHYPRVLDQKEMKFAGIPAPTKICEYPHEYMLYTSADGETFTLQEKGAFRLFGAEHMIRFPETRARYLRLEILSSVGRASERREYFSARIALGEITAFTKE